MIAASRGANYIWSAAILNPALDAAARPSLAIVFTKMIKAAVIRQIEDAWADAPYPGDENIFTPDSYDDEDIGNYFHGTTWRGHDPVALRAHGSAFTFFTPAAFHYWLPAFMLAAIENPDAADVILDQIPRSVSNQYASKRWPLFTEPQRNAVAAYLRFQIEAFGDGAEDDRKALAILESPA